MGETEGSEIGGVGGMGTTDTGGFGSNIGGGPGAGGAVKAGVCTDGVHASGGTDTAGAVESTGGVGGAGGGLLGVGISGSPGVGLIGSGAVPVMSVGTMVVSCWCSQAMVSPSDAIRTAANNAITSSKRRVRWPPTSSTCSTGMCGAWPEAEDSASGSAGALASIRVAEEVS